VQGICTAVWTTEIKNAKKSANEANEAGSEVSD
jgi:hypothetical protein